MTWHPTESPTDEQQIKAVDQLVQSLGLSDHQRVIATHRDKNHCHVHAVFNLVHPTSGKVWSKSHDQQRAELACRQIELDFGWTQDRGRFDAVIDVVDGRMVARLVPKPPSSWQKVHEDRAAGRRKKSSADFMKEKRIGFETFDQTIPDALRKKVMRAAKGAASWSELHFALNTFGLRYETFGSGARIHIKGSAEFAKASSFGSDLSLARLQAKLGPYARPAFEPPPERRNDCAFPFGISGERSAASEKAAQASTFTLTLLRRLYVEIYLDPSVARQIRLVDLSNVPPQITFDDGSVIRDHGRRVTTSDSTPATRAAMLAMAKAKGWTTVRLSGDAMFIREMALEAARAGIRVTGVSEQVKIAADRILQRHRARQRQIDRAAQALQTAHLVEMAERETVLRQNAEARSQRRNLTSDIAARASAAVNALGTGRDAGTRAVRREIRAEQDRLLAALPRVSDPQRAPDIARHDPAGMRRIQRQHRENDRQEIERLKRLDITAVAQAMGWADVSATHPDSSDRKGQKSRILTRGGDTIKCSLRSDRLWRWKSNKRDTGGTIFDLWLEDNPEKNLGHARIALRDLPGLRPEPASGALPREAPQDMDHTAARQRWEQAAWIGSRTDYAQSRGISLGTLRRFATDVRCGPFGGVLFAHRNLLTGDICGFEQRWEKDGKGNTARFASGGRKTVAIFGHTKAASRMVVAEGGMDALAIAELEQRDDTIYLSTAGGFGSATEAALARLGAGRQVFGAFDNDEAGAVLHIRLTKTVPDAKRLAPPQAVPGSHRTCKDWLDVLVAVKEACESSRQSAVTKADLPKLEESDCPFGSR